MFNHYSNNEVEDTVEDIHREWNSGLIVDTSTPNDVNDVSEEEYNRQYDLTPLDTKTNAETGYDSQQNASVSPSYSIDPWEHMSPSEREAEENRLYFESETDGTGPKPLSSQETSETEEDHERDYVDEQEGTTSYNRSHPTFLVPSDIHPNMLQRDEDILQLRLLAGKLNADWGGQEYMAPALARRIRDFQFAQEKRRKKYGDERPWGILGLYEHLSSIRTDVEWAEDAAMRRANGESYLSWADFEANKRKGVNRPFFTYFLILTCSIVLVASFALNGWVLEPLYVNPMIGPSAQTLIRMGAKDSYLIVNDDESWRLISSIFLHAGLVHYFLNTLAVWFLGKAIETSHGALAASILFVIPAIGGTILSAIFLPEYITVGASGGIFGLIGACLADICMNWKLLFSDFVTENGGRYRHAAVVVFLFFDIALNCIIGLTPYVDNFTREHKHSFLLL